MRRLLITGISGDLGRSFVYYLRKSGEMFFVVGIDTNDTFIHVPETDRKYIVPPAKDKNYIKVINKIIKKERIELLIPCSDYEIRVISKNKDKINAKIRLPKYKTIEIAQDRYKSNKIWEAADLPVPKSKIIKNEEQLMANTWLRPRLPISGGAKQAIYAQTEKQAKEWIKKYDGWGNFIMSEYLPGRIYGFDSLWKKGKLIGYQLKERMKYLSSGTNLVGYGTAIIRTCDNEKIVDTCIQAILALDKTPDGCFSVDLRENKEGVACLTEINAGRFLTTSLWLFAEAGHSLPLRYIDMCFDKEITHTDPLPPDLYLFSVKGQNPRLLMKNKLEIMEFKS